MIGVQPPTIKSELWRPHILWVQEMLDGVHISIHWIDRGSHDGRCCEVPHQINDCCVPQGNCPVVKYGFTWPGGAKE